MHGRRRYEVLLLALLAAAGCSGRSPHTLEREQTPPETSVGLVPLEGVTPAGGAALAAQIEDLAEDIAAERRAPPPPEK